MNSLQFPNMFTTSTTKVVNNSYEATLQNLKLLISCSTGELFGDPYYGVNLKRLTFDQNSEVLRTIAAEDIYSKILVFMPQLVVMRKDIKITSIENRLVVKIKAINKVDFTTNMYELSLFETEER